MSSGLTYKFDKGKMFWVAGAGLLLLTIMAAATKRSMSRVKDVIVHIRKAVAGIVFTAASSTANQIAKVGSTENLVH